MIFSQILLFVCLFVFLLFFFSIFHKNRFFTNFKEKAELFNFCFANQCSVIYNGSEIYLFYQISNFKKNKYLSNITFFVKDIENSIQNFIQSTYSN